MRCTLFIILLSFTLHGYAQTSNKKVYPPFDFTSDSVKRGMVSFEADTAESKLNLQYNHLVDSAFHLDSTYEFEFRLWKRHLHPNLDNVYVLTLKDNKWKARYFDLGAGLGNKFTERKVNQLQVNQLWELMVENNVLTLPDQKLLFDRMQKYVVDTTNLQSATISKGDVTDGILYCFELSSPGKKKYYSYHCPAHFLDLFGNIKELYNAVIIIMLIQKYLGQPLRVC